MGACRLKKSKIGAFNLKHPKMDLKIRETRVTGLGKILPLRFVFTFLTFALKLKK
jgi:hypothetical protein